MGARSPPEREFVRSSAAFIVGLQWVWVQNGRKKRVSVREERRACWTDGC